jgi:hypothetical protein
MAYNIRNSVGTVVATIADNSVDNSSSITLIGKNFVGYGERQNQNFYYLLENFAKSTPPSNPIRGQLWYDTAVSSLKVYNGSSFLLVSGESAITNGSSNVRVAANSNVTVSIAGNANVVTVSSSGLSTSGNVTAAFFVGNGSQLTGLSAGSIISNGNSNVVVAANSNVTVNAVGGERLRLTSTGANITGTLTSTGNLSINSNFTVNASNGNTSVAGILGVTGATTLSSTLNVVGNANVGNLGTATAIITTGNITTINSGLLQNGNSNVTIAANGNVTINAVGSERLRLTTTGANITGTFNATGNANVGNLGTAGLITATGNVSGGNLTTSGVVSATGNITTSGFFIGDGSQLSNLSVGAGSSIINGNSNVRVAANSNVTVAVTGADRVVFATTAMTITANILPSANATYSLGSSAARWANIWGVSSSALYADLAEKYWSDDNYDPGTVVKIGGKREITICNEDCSKDVFGCISLAPAYLMNNNDFENYLPVVLHGRSVVKVIGKAAKGDRLVSAGNGCARKGTGDELSYQTEIGRILFDKDYDEIELVEVFISTK